MFDLTNPEGVRGYLEKTSFTPCRVVRLTGGRANFTYRITLREPHVASDLHVPMRTLVAKHAEAYIADWKEMPPAMERQKFEGLAFEFVPRLVGTLSSVRLPMLYYEDRENNLILMTDCGSNARTLLSILRKDPLMDNTAWHVGAALGTFIAQLHSTTRNPMPGTLGHSAKEAFAANQEARNVVGAFFFGHIMPTLNKLQLSSPRLILSSEVLAKLDAFAQKAHERVNTNSDVLLMGDFWAGNVLIVLEPTLEIMVIDWEAARPGFAGMDLGHFLAELRLIYVYYQESRSCIDIIISAFLDAYRTVALKDGSYAEAEQRLAETAHDTAVRVGAHLITMPPRVPRGGPELTGQLVQEGVEYILRSVDGDEAWLQNSIVGGFWSKSAAIKKADFLESVSSNTLAKL